ncbi:MAG: penicillin-binding protein 2 [Paludibacter sp.]|nr:penicillin-binding protein 2 [Bacteroidales bacterium]MCM1068542.1 penicillin-binding protein 2 [Prevotella sp.]MCM1353206.1 penicillin-binding protein 2 [Bacteroides sp.]MCM1442386.1 penicillin-binding protein 2 [Muribaculum sp.]MCM1481205.1 penicillin-binding protein 2 [Paludibacter sp.]
MINDRYYKRRYVISALIIGVVLVYIGQLFYLQIIDQTTKSRADKNALVKQTIYPPRGLIYDRNGELLVFNQPIYEVTMTMQEMGKQFDTIAFCQTLQIDTSYFRKRIADIRNTRLNRGFSRHTPQIFLSQLSKEEIAPLQESLYQFPGIQIRKRTLRGYNYPVAAHVLGSVGEVSQKDIDKDTYYTIGDYCGRDGIERTYENILRGTKGTEVLLRDVRGRIQGSYKNGELDTPASKGEDIILTLDIQLQCLAEELLNGKIGSVVAIEPHSGEILALASNPTWNPALLVGKERSHNYQTLQKDPTKPLLNRATQAQYPPGSPFKLLQSLIGLQQGTLTPNTKYACSGKGSKPISCTHSHGSPIALLNAIEQSCNPYFWCTFRDMLEADGYGKNNTLFRQRYEIWRNDVMEFGYGQRFSDSDIAEQSAGNIPTTGFYDRYYGKTGWKAITIRSLAIGQGEILATPLQLANMAATIANDGYYITPHLNKNDSMLTHKHNTSIDKKHFITVKQGMEQVMTNGTGRYYQIDGIKMGGKTGTAQAGKGKQDHAIFICIAPIENPAIAIAVVVENAGFGATWAAPIASLLAEKYLTDTIIRQPLYDRISTSILNPNVQKR